MALKNKPVAYLRKRRLEPVCYLVVLSYALGYTLWIHFRDRLPIPHLPLLCVAGSVALLSTALMARAYHRELRRRHP